MSADKFQGIIRKKDSLFTLTRYRNSLFGEKILKDHGAFRREWIAKRSKLGAAILNGLGSFPLRSNSRVLYLGASTGTTVSYISDIVSEGMIYAVELSYDPFVKLLNLAEHRDNIIPILEDAGNPEKFSFMVEEPDILYQDISQRDQIRIFNRNSMTFPDIKWAFLVIKARSITARKRDEQILKETIAQISDFSVVQTVDLKPYDVSNYLILLKK